VVVLALFGSGQLTCLENFIDFFIPQANNNILRLEICVNYLAHSVHVIKTNETLSCKLPHQWNGHALVIISLDDLQEVDAQDFEHHDKVLSIWSMVDE